MGESHNEILIIILGSSWLNLALYAVELMLCARYFAHPSRPLLHKVAVAVLVFFDTVCTVAVGFEVCLAVLRLPPTILMTNLRLLLMPFAIKVITTYVSSVISQLFLCNLFHTFTGNKIVAVAILLLIFVHLGFSWASAIITLITGSVGGMAFTTTTVGAVSCAATDVIVAACLGWKFWTLMARGTAENRARTLLGRISTLTVSSGAICASNTLLMMLFLLKGSEVFYIFFSCQGRVYALTILGNFLLGTPARSGNELIRSRRFGIGISNDMVVFPATPVKTAISPVGTLTSTDRFRAPARANTIQSYEPFQRDLGLGPQVWKSDFEWD